MTFDLLVLYRTENIEIDVNNHTLHVIIREIPHGEFVGMQKAMMGEFSLSQDKRAMEQQINKIKFSAPEFADRKALLGISQWSISNGDGIKNELPVNLEVWHKLPHWITEQIEKGIEKLNPDLDDEFQD